MDQTTTLQNKLRELGADLYDLLLPETHALAAALKKDETIRGIVYGRYRRQQFNEITIGRGMLVATDKRLILLDKKPLFYKSDDIAYRAATGVTVSHAGPAATVSLHTKSGDIHMRTFNMACAERFVAVVEETLHETW